MSNMNDYPNLKSWCEKHYEDTKIKVYPQTVPMQTIMDEMLGRLSTAEAALAIACAQAKEAYVRIAELEGSMKVAEKRIEQKRRIKVTK